MELSPWSNGVSDSIRGGHLFGVRVDVVGADTGEDFLEQSNGISRCPSVQQFSRFMYHLGLIYEVSRLGLDPQYRRFRFPRLQFRPTISRLSPFDQMVMVRINQNSPWQLSSAFIFEAGTVTAGALGGVWLFVQSLDKLSMMPLNRRKLRAEIEKIELESAKLKTEMSPPMISLRQIAHSAGETKTEPGKKKQRKRREDGSSEDLILPPEESLRLFNLLRRRGAKKFYDENTQAARNLGFKVEQVTVTVDDKYTESHNGQK